MNSSHNPWRLFNDYLGAIFVSGFLNKDQAMTPEQMIRCLLFYQILNNPLPWKIERDWTYEVIAVNGQVIAKCQAHEQAMEIIRTAEKIKKEIDSIDDWPISELHEGLAKLLDQKK